MSDKVVSLEESGGAFKIVFERILQIVPERDKDDKKLQRLLAFRLKLDGEAALSEYLIWKIREMVRCSYTGSLYEFLKDDLKLKECREQDIEPQPSGAA
jgi:hypothetical protein